jgi:exosortase/archaeosortase family protein
VHHNAQGVSLGITLFGLILQICGWRATKLLLFPLCYFVVFGQSISDRLLQLITERMQDWSAIGSFYALALIGIDVDRSGNVISIYVNGEPRQLNVAEACSGMRMLVAFLALGVAIAYTGLTRNWQRALLIAAGFPVALGVNVLRVFTLGILQSLKSGAVLSLSNSATLKFGEIVIIYSPLSDALIAVLLGIICGLLGALFVSVNSHMIILRKKYVNTNLKKVIEVLLFSLATSTAFFWLSAANASRPGNCKVNTHPNLTEEEQYAFTCPGDSFNTQATLFFNTEGGVIRALLNQTIN